MKGDNKKQKYAVQIKKQQQQQQDTYINYHNFSPLPSHFIIQWEKTVKRGKLHS